MYNCPCYKYETYQSQSNQSQQIKSIKCQSCNYLQHEECISEQLKMRNYECPSCQLLHFDPYIKTVENVLQPALLMNRNGNSQKECNFVISTNVISKINEYKHSQSLTNNGKLYILIRCIRLDDIGYEHHWPLNGSIVLNKTKLKEMKVLKYPPRSKPRQDYPYVIYFKEEDKVNNEHMFQSDHFISSDMIRFDGINSLIVYSNFSINDDDRFSYVVSIDLIKILSTEQVISSIEKISSTDNIIKAINKDKDLYPNEVKLSSIVIKPKDPFSDKLISIPVRSFNCQHVDVFDLETFLYIKRKNKVYNCPICRVKACRLYVDMNIDYIFKTHPFKDMYRLDYQLHYIDESLFSIKSNEDAYNCSMNWKGLGFSNESFSSVKDVSEVKDTNECVGNVSKSNKPYSYMSSEVIVLDDDMNEDVVNNHMLLSNINGSIRNDDVNTNQISQISQIYTEYIENTNNVNSSILNESRISINEKDNIRNKENKDKSKHKDKVNDNDKDKDKVNNNIENENKDKSKHKDKHKDKLNDKDKHNDELTIGNHKQLNKIKEERKRNNKDKNQTSNDNIHNIKSDIVVYNSFFNNPIIDKLDKNINNDSSYYSDDAIHQLYKNIFHIKEDSFSKVAVEINSIYE